jgi:hypothetical protein
LKRSERTEAFEAFNEIESILADETLKSFRTPDFWDNLAPLGRLMKFSKEFCQELP